MSNSDHDGGGSAASPLPPPTGADSGASATDKSQNSGCAAVFGLVTFIAGIALIASGSGSGFSSTCSDYPEDGYCSAQDLVQGAGWMVLIVGFLALAGVARQARKNEKNSSK